MSDFLRFWTERRIFWGVLALAAALRAVAAIPLAFHHADELWQYVEPAYHIAVGPWVMSWEMRDGIRTWLIPMVLAGPMAAGEALGDPLLPPKLVLVALSLVIVGSATALGLRLSRLHGALAGGVAAVWFELVFFGPRALSEPVALALLMGAVWCLLTGVRSDRRVFLAGLLLGLAFAARFQFAPAILTLAVWEGRTRWRVVWLPLVLGGVAGLAVDGLADLAMGQVPFRWVLENFRLNLIEHRSDGYGVSPPLWYLAKIVQIWGWATLPLLVLAGYGARRYPVLLAVALVHLAAHMLIPHKEYRFILPTTALLVVLAGIGSAELLRRLPVRALPAAAVAAAVAWSGVSLALGATEPYRGHWTANRSFAEAIRISGRVQGVCGVGLYRQDLALAGAYALYDRPTPIYVFRGPDAAADAGRLSGAYTVLMAPASALAGMPPGYRPVHCDPPGRWAQCVYARPGNCTPAGAAAFEINRAAANAGE